VRQFTPQAGKLLNLIETDLGRPINQIRPNVEIPDLEQMASAVIDTLTVESLEVRDHNGHWYNLQARPYKTLDNRIEGAVITLIDIDDIKDAERLRKAQTAVQESERRLQAIINNSNTMIVAKDPEGRYLLVNQMAETLLGLSADKIIGKTDHELASQEYADLWSRNDKEVLRRGEAIEFEELIPYKGSEHAFVSVKFPLRTADGEIYAVAGIATDITERYRSAQTLQRLATVVRDSNDAITVLGFDGVIQAWNPAAGRLYGWSEAEALKLNIYDILPVPEQPGISRVLERMRNGETPKPMEVSRITKTGESLRIRLTLSLLVDQNGHPKAVATTEQKIL
jgi:PAS domain S-box-containing protein